MSYKKVPDGMDFSTEFDTYIIAYCPDQNEFYEVQDMLVSELYVGSCGRCI